MTAPHDKVDMVCGAWVADYRSGVQADEDDRTY